MDGDQRLSGLDLLAHLPVDLESDRRVHVVLDAGPAGAELHGGQPDLSGVEPGQPAGGRRFHVSQNRRGGQPVALVENARVSALPLDQAREAVGGSSVVEQRLQRLACREHVLLRAGGDDSFRR